ncbi:MAG: GspH/FimT family protein [Betaproteobacteria bacterium]
MIALAIVAILGGLGAAGYGSVSGRTRATAEASNLLNAVELMRSEAIKRGRRVTLAPEGGNWAGGWSLFVDANNNRALDPGEPLILRHGPLNSSTRVIVDTTPGYIAFGYDGIPRQYGGGFLAATVAFCDAGSSGSIVIAKSGRPRAVAGKC